MFVLGERKTEPFENVNQYRREPRKCRGSDVIRGLAASNIPRGWHPWAKFPKWCLRCNHRPWPSQPGSSTRVSNQRVRFSVAIPHAGPQGLFSGIAGTNPAQAITAIEGQSLPCQ